MKREPIRKPKPQKPQDGTQLLGTGMAQKAAKNIKAWKKRQKDMMEKY